MSRSLSKLLVFLGLIVSATGALADGNDQRAIISQLCAALAAREYEIMQLKATIREVSKIAPSAMPRSEVVVMTGPQTHQTPSSSLTYRDGQKLAESVASALPGTVVNTVLPTGSMKPVFDEHAVLLMEEAPFEDLRVGDIVTYRHEKLDAPVVHRLVIKEGDKFWARGDANSRMDNTYITKDNYLRRVYGVIYTHPKG